jgi:hypothetical protein
MVQGTKNQSCPPRPRTIAINVLNTEGYTAIAMLLRYRPFLQMIKKSLVMCMTGGRETRNAKCEEGGIVRNWSRYLSKACHNVK